MSDWIREAGHELRQPMQVLSVCAGALDYQLHDPAARATLGNLRQATAELERLLDLLAGQAALAGARLQATMVEVNLQLLLDRVGAQLAREFSTLPAGLAADTGAMPLVRTDPLLLERLLWHLCRALLAHNGARGLQMVWGSPAGSASRGRRVRLCLRPHHPPALSLVQPALFADPPGQPAAAPAGPPGSQAGSGRSRLPDGLRDGLSLPLVHGLADLLDVVLALECRGPDSAHASLLLPAGATVS